MTEEYVEFEQLTWNENVEERARQLVRMAIEEDLGGERDWTSWSTIEQDSVGAAEFVNRVSGVVCGLPLITMVVEELRNCDTTAGEVGWEAAVEDGTFCEARTKLGAIRGDTRSILQVERTALNFIGRLSGIATLTHQFASQIGNTKAGIYDTRKTTPGWRLLEKYAVQCGGGRNHRLGLYAAVMLKDNHVASRTVEGEQLPLPEKIQRAQERLVQAKTEGLLNRALIFEVEVDSLEQFQKIVSLDIDIVLLDNMPPEKLKEAIRIRDQYNPRLQLEASGGISLDTVAAVAETGIDRISSGSLTHSATNWDVGLDWLS